MTFRVLLIEDNEGRVAGIRSWPPPWAQLVWAPSADAALGLIQRDRGHVYGGVMLDHGLGERAMTDDDRALSGSDVAPALIKHFSIDIPVLIHSTNLVKVPHVARELEQKRFWLTRIPWHDLRQDAFVAWLTDAHDIWESLEGP